MPPSALDAVLGRLRWRAGPRPAIISGVSRHAYEESMKQKRAQELQNAWAGGPCEHPQLAKVYDLGAHTGNFACVKCGQMFTYREKAELTAARRGA